LHPPPRASRVREQENHRNKQPAIKCCLFLWFSCSLVPAIGRMAADACYAPGWRTGRQPGLMVFFFDSSSLRVFDENRGSVSA